MKHLFAPLALIASSLLLSSCFFNFKTNNNQTRIHPSGEMVTTDYDFKDVKEIRIDFPIALEYTQTETPQSPGSVSVTIDKAYADYLDVTFSDGKLRLKLDGNIAVISLVKESVIRVSSPYITTVEVKGSSDVLFTNGLVVNDDLDISIAGSGSVSGEGISVKDLDLNIAGSGDIRLGSIVASSADVNLTGSGNVTFAGVTLEALEVNIAGSGDFEASGNSDSVEISILGSGCADISSLEYNNLDTEIRGSGEVKK